MLSLSHYFGIVIGAFLLLLNLAMLLNRNYYKKCIASTENSPAFTYTLGLFSLILGLIIVGAHNEWILNWSVLITVTGWLLLLQGVGRLFFPEETNNFLAEFHEKNGYWILVTIAMLIGIYMLWEGMHSENLQAISCKF
jgi:hypothetical protein